MHAPIHFPRALRVNQVDALRVDQELVLLLQEEANGILRRLLPLSAGRWQRELFLAIQLFFFCAYTLRNRPSPGDLLQNVKYRSQADHGPSTAAGATSAGSDSASAVVVEAASSLQGQIGVPLASQETGGSTTRRQEAGRLHQFLPRRTKLVILLLSILLPYGFEVLQNVITERYLALLAVLQQRARRAEIRQRFQQRRQQQGTAAGTSAAAPSSSGAEAVALASHTQPATHVPPVSLTRDERLLVVAYRGCQALHVSLVALQLVQAIRFLLDGTHRSVTDWLLGLEMEVIAPSLPRNISLELLQHQLYWHAFTQLMLLVVPNLPQHHLLFQRLLRLRRFSGDKLIFVRRHLLEWLRSKEADLLRRETQASERYTQHSAQETRTASAAAEPVEGRSKLGLQPTGKRSRSKGLAPQPPPALDTTLGRSRRHGAQSARSPPAEASGIHQVRSLSWRVKASLARIGALCSIHTCRFLRASCAAVARLTQGGLEYPLSAESAMSGDRVHQPDADIWEGAPRASVASSFVEDVVSGDGDAFDSAAHAGRPCVFCGKEDILVPFQGDTCRHRFCYWCVASHPLYRPPPTEQHSRRPQSENSISEEESESLECPECGAPIRRIAWAR
ncbi:Pex2 / Pex12 amino terminal region protein [Besnoitia besnoiti]|uniref:RING-type E3 ubiquitin transferase (cysteine targeting) n=1 Tax=Besnoitia besnoiti TaxID=94643 RepID=A0A2A9MBB5_BESBE|nr:Pex2 / Pex12 amino terminal region protein [Besnoitia besnoiti]PFH33216.1 Pex2 / Pex12 amino terminal region protein [Besnoitia besnoiti]